MPPIFYVQPLTGVEHSRWDIGHRGIVSYLSFGCVTPNSPGGPGGFVRALSVHDLGSTIEGHWHLLNGVRGSGANDGSEIGRV